MKLVALFILALSWGSLSFAALPEGVSPAQWEALLARISAEGTRMDTDYGTYLTLTRREPDDKSVTHTAAYISEVGAFSDEGVFHASHVESVYESWEKLANGNWAIDQWVFPVSADGDLRRCFHAKILETSDGSVLDHQLHNLSDEAAMEAWSPRLLSWF